MNAVRFSLDDAQRAAEEWGANCGPAAIAAVLDKTLDEVRPHLGDFERPGKRYTNPTLMYATLRSIGATFTTRIMKGVVSSPSPVWPILGLVRVQWEGPWTEPGVPMAARYRHTHWIGARQNDHVFRPVEIFDVNAMCVGGWIPVDEWSAKLVPWLLSEVEPKASGGWHQTHVLELRP